MTRAPLVGAAQMGPVQREHSRGDVVERLIAMLRDASIRGCSLVVFPELALTTFFPRWVFDPGAAALDAYFEAEMPGPETRPLFEEAKRLGIGFYLGYAEKAGPKRFNTTILVDREGTVVGKYRKIHLPGHVEPDPTRKGEHLEKRYFDVGDLGWPVFETMGGRLGMAICNDRRWPETYRVMGLQGVELVMIGYNTPVGLGEPFEQAALANFHNALSLQSGAYHNATWVVGAAKCGTEEGFDMIGQSMIVAPTGEIVAQCTTLEDELITARCDLDAAQYAKTEIFNFARHRRPEHYGLIVERAGAGDPLPPREGSPK